MRKEKEYNNWPDLIGVPYRRKGKDPATGLCCYGLVYYVKHMWGKAFPDYDKLVVNGCSNSLRLQAGIQEYFDCVDVPTREDIVAISTICTDEITHVGIMVDSRRFLHTTKETGVVWGAISTKAYRRKIRSFHRCRT